MSKVTITPKARADLKEISRYTDKTWGRQQRFIYLKRLRGRIELLARYPQSGKMRDDIWGKPYSFHEGRHVIFYRVTEEGIEVLRVLHDARDFQRHFT